MRLNPIVVCSAIGLCISYYFVVIEKNFTFCFILLYCTVTKEIQSNYYQQIDFTGFVNSIQSLLIQSVVDDSNMMGKRLTQLFEFLILQYLKLNPMY